MSDEKYGPRPQEHCDKCPSVEDARAEAERHFMAGWQAGAASRAEAWDEGHTVDSHGPGLCECMNPYLTAARAETTTDLHWSNAAAAEYPGDEHEQDPLRTAFGRGVKWERERAKTTSDRTATTEDAEGAVYGELVGIPGRSDVACARDAHYVVKALAAAGLLATARPTRQQIEEAIETGKQAFADALATHRTTGPQNDYIAEEIRALLEGTARPDTTTEWGVRHGVAITAVGTEKGAHARAAALRDVGAPDATPVRREVSAWTEVDQ